MAIAVSSEIPEKIQVIDPRSNKRQRKEEVCKVVKYKLLYVSTRSRARSVAILGLSLKVSFFGGTSFPGMFEIQSCRRKEKIKNI